MKNFDSVYKYLESAKVGDLVALGGNGLVLKSYRGRKRLRIHECFYGQPVGVLTSAEFKKLSK